MTDMPDEIWITPDESASVTDYKYEDQVKYIRADLVPQWKTIDSAPRDGTEIRVWTCHEKDPYHLGDGKLTIYGAWCEIEGHAADGFHTAIFGGGFDDRSYYEPNGGYMPDWWFINNGGNEFELPCNPTHWKPLDNPPTEDTDND